jgi:hypothetical protein
LERPQELTTRQDIPSNESARGLQFVKTNYGNADELAKILQGVHVVLSFIAPHRDQQEAIDVQRNLIDASVQAHVKRFAPSEWGVKQFAPSGRDS